MRHNNLAIVLSGALSGSALATLVNIIMMGSIGGELVTLSIAIMLGLSVYWMRKDM